MKRRRNKLLRRKHRIVVEVTFEDMIIEKEAIRRTSHIIKVSESKCMESVTTFECKGWTRVFPVYFRKAMMIKKSKGDNVIYVYPLGGRYDQT